MTARDSHSHDHHTDPVGEWLPTVLPDSGGMALDIGCGDGRHATQLAERFERVVAVDLSESMIELARQRRARPNIEYRVGDVMTLSGEYDFVFSSGMLHHVADANAALAQIAACVRPGGRAVLVDVLAPARGGALTRDQFQALYSEALPGAKFESAGVLGVCIWDART